MSPHDKVCIKTECHWKAHCGLYFKSADQLHRQYIKPEFSADACPHYQPMREPAWGEGGEPND